jgi:hypothetical protein
MRHTPIRFAGIADALPAPSTAAGVRPARPTSRLTTSGTGPGAVPPVAAPDPDCLSFENS